MVHHSKNSNPLNLTPFCTKTFKQKIRQAYFSGFQWKTRQPVKQKEQYMAAPLCCVSVECQDRE
jgi:hypothetical protein